MNDDNNIKPEILMVSTDRHGKGGIASVVNTYMEGGLKENFNINFLVTHIEGLRSKKLLNFLYALLKLLRFLVGRKCSVFHIHTASRSSFIRKSIVSWLGKICGKKIILHLHGGEFMEYYNKEAGFFLRWYIKRTFGIVDKVIVLSSQWKNNILEITNDADVEVIFNPVLFGGVEKKVSGKKILLFLGRIGRGKGFWDILNALLIVKETHNDFVFKFGGDGELDKAEDMIRRLGLESYTEYLGWVSGDEKKRLLQQSLIYLLPSYNEGLPIGILEAMAAKVTVITCPVGGIPDAIEDMVNGIVVPTGNVEDLSKAIIKLLDSDRLCHSLAEKAYADVENKFSVNVIVPKIESLYQTLSL